MQEQVSIKLFGSIEAEVNGAPLPRLHSRKGLLLLAMAALNGGRPISREWAASALWPESPEPTARFNLRQCLRDLRVALGEHAGIIISPDRNHIAFDTSMANVDVLEFDACIAKADPASLDRAIALYRGHLVQDCWEEWLHTERIMREAASAAALEQRIDGLIADGEVAGACRYLRLLISRDPCNEPFYERLMSLLKESGDSTAAMQVYRQLTEALDRELGTKPGPRSEAIYREVCDVLAKHKTTQRRGAEFAGSIPVKLTRFYGRTAELRQLQEMLAPSTQDACRLITISGPGGCGKTRLAAAAAASVESLFDGGVWFVPLNAVSEPALVPAAIARALGLISASQADPILLLAGFLRSQTKPCLLVLDNLEQLLLHEDGPLPTILNQLLTDVLHLHILATSRRRLMIEGEADMPLVGLEAPQQEQLERAITSPDSAALLAEYPAIALFADRARLARPGFAIRPGNIEAIAALCHRLDGLPLGIELAAARADTLAPARILEMLKSQPGLSASHVGAPERHRSLNTAIGWSVQNLSPELRTVFQCLGMFYGPFTVDAVIALLQSTDDHSEWSISRLDVCLRELVRGSLLTVEPADAGTRYRLLETIREYARDQIAAEDRRLLAEAHLTYYAALASNLITPGNGLTQAECLNELEASLGNLYAAIDTACELKSSLGLEIVLGLTQFWDVRGGGTEGRRRLVQVIEAVGEPVDSILAVQLAAAWRAASYLAMVQGDYSEAMQRSLKALEISEDAADQPGECRAAADVANTWRNMGDLQRAEPWIKRAISLARSGKDVPGLAYCLRMEGNYQYDSGRIEAAGTCFEEALKLFEACGDLARVANMLGNLGSVACDIKDYSRARSLLERSLQIRRELGDQLGICQSLGNLARVGYIGGDLITVRAQWQEVLAIHKRVGDARGAAFVLSNLGNVAFDCSDYREAVRLHQEALEIRRGLGAPVHIADSLRNTGIAATFCGDYETAARCLESALSLRSEEPGQSPVETAVILEARAFLKHACRHGDEARLDLNTAKLLREDADARGTWPGTAPRSFPMVLRQVFTSE